MVALAVVPSATPGDSRAPLDALCAALARKLGVPVTGAMPDSYGALATELERDRVQYAWMPPLLAVLSRERVRLRPLLSAVRGDRTDYRGVLFVDAAGPLHAVDDGDLRPAGSAAEGRRGSIEELRGKTVAWVDDTSAAGYLFPRLTLAARGLDPTTLFGEELFARSHAEVARAVFAGRAHVGATYAEKADPVRRAGFLDAAPPGRAARVIEWSRPIPNDVIVGHGQPPKPQHVAFANAIVDLATTGEGRAMLFRAFHAEVFTPTPAGALDPLWGLVYRARQQGLLLQL